MLPGDIIRFSNSESNVTLLVLDCFCVTYKDPGTTEVGKCLYNCFNNQSSIDDIYSEVGRDNHVCDKFNRQGTLCGQCQNNTFTLAYSFDLTCMECPHSWINWFKYITVAFVPLTIFYFIVVLFRINIVSSHLIGFVIYSQGVSMPVLSRVLLMGSKNRPKYFLIVKVVNSLYGIWNLDFFRQFEFEICLGTSSLFTLSLDLIVALYPLLLIILSYFLITLYDRECRPLVYAWRPFRKIFSLFRNNWDIRTSLIDSFATFLLLSNVKILSVAYDLLLPVTVYTLSPSGQFNYSRNCIMMLTFLILEESIDLTL